MKDLFVFAKYNSYQHKLQIKTNIIDRYGGSRWFSMDYISNIETAQKIVNDMGLTLIVQNED